MSAELTIQPAHTCNINLTLNDSTAPLSDDTLTLLFNSLETHNKTWGPRTQEQCLRGDTHQDICIKDLTKETLDIYTRKVQTAFLENQFARKWGKPFIGNLIKSLPTDALEAFRFLTTIPNKTRAASEDDTEYTNDKELFRACKKTKDIAVCIDAFDAALTTKDPELVATAFEILPSDSGKFAKIFLEKAHNALLIAPTKTAEDQAVSERLFKLLGTKVSHTQQSTWALFIQLFEEYYRISYQLNEPLFISAYSTSEKQTLTDEVDSELYTHVRALLRSDNPENDWNKIPDSLKIEYAATFACLITRIRLTSANPTFLAITKDFTDTTVKLLDTELQTAINMILKADTFLYKLASPIGIAERSRLRAQLNSPNPKLAYSTSKEDVVEPEEDLYTHLNKLNNTRKLDEIWQAIPAYLKKEYAITFARMLHDLANHKKNIKKPLKDFYETTVPLLDKETQLWIQCIISEK